LKDYEENVRKELPKKIKENKKKRKDERSN